MGRHPTCPRPPAQLKECGDSAAAEAVRVALSSKISESRAPLDAQHIGNALYGLKECGHAAAAEAVRVALASKISES